MGNELVPFSEMKEMANVMARSQMFGKTPEQMLSLMLLAQAEGIHPATAAMEYDVIKGKPAINSRSALARFQSAGGSIRWISRKDTEAEAEFSHPLGGALKVKWDIERAKKAGIYNKENKDGSPNMWQKFPAQMLSARVVGEGVRAVYPACLSRLYLTEEVQDFDTPKKERDVTPEPEVVVEVEPEEPKSEPKNDITSMADFIRLINSDAVPMADRPEWMKQARGGKDVSLLREIADKIQRGEKPQPTELAKPEISSPPKLEERKPVIDKNSPDYIPKQGADDENSLF
jgi:hypothetical protein